jgi:type IV pilus assembly protein PilQ
MMRLKKLLGIVTLAIATTAVASASAAQLSGVLVKSRDSAGVVTIMASGAFTHTEYRPADNLMLVDLAGISMPRPDPRVHAVFAPGIRSYRVSPYRSSSGGEVVRVELTLVPGAKASVNDVDGGLEVRVTGAAAVVPSKRDIEAASHLPSRHAAVTRVHNISVVRADGGLNVEITGNGPMTASTMKLKSPDRLVVDIPNALLEGRPREISVNSNDIRGVRAARYQDAPPATRVVVDLATMRDFEVVPQGNKLVVRLKDGLGHSAPATQTALAGAAVIPAATGKSSTPAAPATVEAKAAEKPVTVASNNGPAPDVVVSNPTFTSKPAGKTENTEEASVEAKPSRADTAASRFAQNQPTVASENTPPYPVSARLSVTPAAINAALLQQQAQSTGPAGGTSQVGNCTTGRYTGEPIGMNFKDLDLKDFFRVIHEISGLNVVLDPAVKGSVTIVLDDVPWDQALAIVLHNNGLECQLQGNVLRIATLETLKTEADARRAQQEAQALAVPREQITRYLSYGQAKDAVTIVKKFLSQRGDVVADQRSNALIIEDIPSYLAKVDPILKTLDRKTPEVEIEARVVASTRTFARDIGTQLGYGFGSGHSAAGGATANSPIHVGFPAGVVPRFITGQNDPTAIPLFSDLGATGPSSGIEFTTATPGFRLDFILTMAESRGLLKVLSRPQITTQNNIKALIRQGTRVPVVTAAQLGGPPTVQYIDAFLRLTVTPQITAENTIFLDIDVENTVADVTSITGSQINPTLDTQQATTQVLVADGGTVVIGGVVQTQNNLAIAQVPLLGSIPLLGNLFKHQSVKTSTQELIFFITPKIIQT